MTATHPDSHPDSLPAGTSDDVEQVTPSSEPGRESVEDSPDSPESTSATDTHDGSPLDPPGISDGVSGTAGDVKVQDMHDNQN